MQLTEREEIIAELKNFCDLVGKNSKYYESNISAIADRLRTEKHTAKQVKAAKEYLLQNGIDTLNYIEIKNAVKETTPALMPQKDCPFCEGRGAIVAKYFIGNTNCDGKDMYGETLFACKCEDGRELSEERNMHQWKGEDVISTQKFGRCYPVNLHTGRTFYFEHKKPQNREKFAQA
jgi:hypothetical protein